jgi:hypothetical protein
MQPWHGAFAERAHRRLVDALRIETEALGSVVTATELDGVGTEFAQAPPLLGAVRCGERAGGESVTGGNGVGEEVSDREAGAEARGVLGKLPGERQGFLLEEPISVAALPPLGEVLGADGSAGEDGRHDGLNLGKGVEPGGQVFGLLAIVEAAVQLIADAAGEAGDFAGASRVHTGLLRAES